MDWMQPVDIYCERLDASFWSEPVNALTNLAFVLAALFMWPRVRELDWGRILCVMLALIGVASGAFHTYAVGLTGAADVLSIIIFALSYIYLANRDFWGMRWVWAWLAAVAFLPYAALTIPVFEQLPGLGVSSQYMPLPVMIVAYGALLYRRYPQTGRNLWIGGGILMVSIGFRSADLPVCEGLPLGTHFIWHILNAVMLAWMIETWARHVREM